MTIEQLMTIIIIELNKYRTVRSMTQEENVLTVTFTDGTEKVITVE